MPAAVAPAVVAPAVVAPASTVPVAVAAVPQRKAMMENSLFVLLVCLHRFVSVGFRFVKKVDESEKQLSDTTHFIVN